MNFANARWRKQNIQKQEDMTPIPLASNPDPASKVKAVGVTPSNSLPSSDTARNSPDFQDFLLAASTSVAQPILDSSTIEADFLYVENALAAEQYTSSEQSPFLRESDDVVERDHSFVDGSVVSTNVSLHPNVKPAAQSNVIQEIEAPVGQPNQKLVKVASSTGSYQVDALTSQSNSSVAANRKSTGTIATNEPILDSSKTTSDEAPPAQRDPVLLDGNSNGARSSADNQHTGLSKKQVQQNVPQLAVESANPKPQADTNVEHLALTRLSSRDPDFMQSTESGDLLKRLGKDSTLSTKDQSINATAARAESLPVNSNATTPSLLEISHISLHSGNTKSATKPSNAFEQNKTEESNRPILPNDSLPNASQSNVSQDYSKTKGTFNNDYQIQYARPLSPERLAEPTTASPYNGLNGTLNTSSHERLLSEKAVEAATVEQQQSSIKPESTGADQSNSDSNEFESHSNEVLEPLPNHRTHNNSNSASFNQTAAFGSSLHAEVLDVSVNHEGPIAESFDTGFTERPRRPTAATSPVSNSLETSATASDPHGVVKQVADVTRLSEAIESAAIQESNRIKLNLEPKELGSLTIEVHRTDEVARINIVTENPAAHLILERNIELLVNSLENREALTVEVDVSQGEADTSQSESDSRTAEHQPENPKPALDQQNNTSLPDEEIKDQSHSVNMRI